MSVEELSKIYEVFKKPGPSVPEVIEKVKQILIKQPNILSVAIVSIKNIISEKTPQIRSYAYRIINMAIDLVRNKTNENIKEQEMKAIIQVLCFLCDRLHDFFSLDLILSGILKILRYFLILHLPSEDVKKVISGLFDKVTCQSQTNQKRTLYYEIHLTLMKKYPKTIDLYGTKQYFVRLLNNIEGERDPVNLLQMFDLIKEFNKIPSGGSVLDELNENIIDICLSYFPVEFRKLPGDNREVSQRQLSENLQSVMFLRKSFGHPLFNCLFEKLTFFPRNKIAIIRALTSCAVHFGLTRELMSMIPECWSVLTTELLRTKIPDPFTGAISNQADQVERAIVGAFIKFVPLISRKPKDEDDEKTKELLEKGDIQIKSLLDKGCQWLENPSNKHKKTYVTLAGKLFTSVATSSPYNLVLSMDYLSDILIQDYISEDHRNEGPLVLMNHLLSAFMLFTETGQIDRVDSSKVIHRIKSYYLDAIKIDIENKMIMHGHTLPAYLEGFIKCFLSFKMYGEVEGINFEEYSNLLLPFIEQKCLLTIKKKKNKEKEEEEEEEEEVEGEKKEKKKSGGTTTTPLDKIGFNSFLAITDWVCKHMKKNWVILHDQILQPLLNELIKKGQIGRNIIYECMEKWIKSDRLIPSLISLSLEFLEKHDIMKLQKLEVSRLLQIAVKISSEFRYRQLGPKPVNFDGLYDILWKICQKYVSDPFDDPKILHQIGQFFYHIMLNFQEDKLDKVNWIHKTFHSVVLKDCKSFIENQSSTKSFPNLLYLYVSILTGSRENPIPETIFPMINRLSSSLITLLFQLKERKEEEEEWYWKRIDINSSHVQDGDQPQLHLKIPKHIYEIIGTILEQYLGRISSVLAKRIHKKLILPKIKKGGGRASHQRRRASP